MQAMDQMFFSARRDDFFLEYPVQLTVVAAVTCCVGVAA